MDTVRLLYTIILYSTIIMAIFLIAYAFPRRNIPGAGYFIALMVCAIFYSSTYMGEINSNNISTAMIWFNLEHIPIPIEHYLWLMMSLKYVRIPKKQIRLFKYIMLYHPVIYMLIYYTNPIHHLYISSVKFEGNGYFPVLRTVKGPLFFFLVLSGTIIGIICTAYYVYGFLKVFRLQRSGYVIMIIASLAPWSAVYIGAVNLSPLGVDCFPVFSAFSGLMFAYGMFSKRIFNTVPIAMETVFRNSKEGIMLVDQSDMIIDVNNSFLKLYPGVLKLPGKKFFSDFINSHTEFVCMKGENMKAEYQRQVDGEIHHFSADITKITIEEEGVLIGKILTIEDITLFVEQKKKLEGIASDAIIRAESNELSFLQAQIKPHFLNNTLSVIASMITRSPDEAKELIAQLGEHLSNCYYFDSSSPMVPLEKELESVNTYVFIEKARFCERINFHLICENMPEIFIPRLVIQPLVENAIRHGILKKISKGNIWLIIDRNDDSVCFEIRDDGVGMSEDVIQKSLHDESTTRSIGISNINKRLLKYYGAGLQIASKQGQGTQVRFNIPLSKAKIFTGRVEV